jgi:hypothetical protein
MKWLFLTLLLLPNLTRAAEAPPPMSPCECAAKKVCWKLVLGVDEEVLGLYKREVEGGLPNRFFPGTLTFVPRRPTSDGHFLIVQCGPGHRPCTDKRDILEERLIKSAFLKAISGKTNEDSLFDPKTFQVTDPGEQLFAKVRQCRKTLLLELAAIALRSEE